MARRSKLAALVLAALLITTAARAQDAASGFYSHSFSAVAAAAKKLAASGDSQAPEILNALRRGHLYVRRDGQPGLYERQEDDSFTDIRSGKPAQIDPDDLRPVRVNNAVRVSVGSAIAILGLTSPDDATRRSAAANLFANPDEAALPALDHALARERNPGTRRALREARAACILDDQTAPVPDRLQAVRILRERGDLAARSELQGLSGGPPALQGAARSAVAAIDHSLRLWSFAQSTFYGISLGSVLLIAAMGLAITFGVMGVINMAHGEIMMIGAYVTWLIQRALAAHAPGLEGASLIIALPAAFIVCGALGVVIERGLIRFLYGRPLETLLATWGLSLILQQVVRSLFGPTNVAVDTPSWMSGAIAVGGLTLTLNRLVIIIFALALMGGLMIMLRATPLGLYMRAVTQNRRMAAAMGIRTPWIDAATFGLGSGIAGIAGVAISQIDNVSPNLGQNYIIDSFMVVVFGGVGNLWGTLIGAMTLGITDKFLEPFAGAVLGKIAILLLVILFIQRRPRGMFPVKGRAVES